MKKLNVGWLISVSAVGSLRERYKPLDIVIIDQFFDRTTKRIATYFEKGLTAHIAFSDPVCARLGDILYETAQEAGAVAHRGGSYVNMEGPAFSTRAESEVYRKMGMDLIGMTNLTEAKLAREAEICYATMAMVTDYDCWHPQHEAVTVETITGNLKKNAETAKKIIRQTVKRIPRERDCGCAHALETAIMTDRGKIPQSVRKKLEPIIGKYLKAE
jgi:5'-methylthioadenosine phosphorylase